MSAPPDPRRTRRLVLAGGTGLLAVVAAVMALRGVDPVETAATVLFIPVFLAVVFAKVTGGLVAAVVAFVVYVGLRWTAIAAVGVAPFAGTITARGLGYLAFGVLGGLAMRQVEASLAKLERYDAVDDVTGLGNARLFVDDIDLERSRAQRYDTIFSVLVIDVDADALAAQSRRARARTLRAVADVVRDAVRTVDRCVHASDGARHRFAVILPETPAGGAAVLGGRLTDQIRNTLADHTTDAKVAWKAVTHPGPAKPLQVLRDEFAAINAAQHPDTPTPTTT